MTLRLMASQTEITIELYWLHLMAAEGRHSSVTAYTAVRNYNRQLNSFASIECFGPLFHVVGHRESGKQENGSLNTGKNRIK